MALSDLDGSVSGGFLSPDMVFAEELGSGGRADFANLAEQGNGGIDGAEMRADTAPDTMNAYFQNEDIGAFDAAPLDLSTEVDANVGGVALDALLLSSAAMPSKATDAQLDVGEVEGILSELMAENALAAMLEQIDNLSLIHI